MKWIFLFAVSLMSSVSVIAQKDLTVDVGDLAYEIIGNDENNAKQVLQKPYVRIRTAKVGSNPVEK